MGFVQQILWDFKMALGASSFEIAPDGLQWLQCALNVLPGRICCFNSWWTVVLFEKNQQMRVFFCEHDVIFRAARKVSPQRIGVGFPQGALTDTPSIHKCCTRR